MPDTVIVVVIPAAASLAVPLTTDAVNSVSTAAPPDTARPSAIAMLRATLRATAATWLVAFTTDATNAAVTPVEAEDVLVISTASTSRLEEGRVTLVVMDGRAIEIRRCWQP
jgi:hypothetical protein